MNSPFPLSTIDNPFGPSSPEVQAYYHKALGLKGHPGVDFNAPYGTPIPCAADGVVSATLSKDNADPSFFRAVNTIVEIDGSCYEVQYGHCSEIDVSVGDKVTAGQIVAKVGNTGTVFYNGEEVTTAQKLAGSHNGSHCHFQVRVIEKVPASTPDEPGVHYLNDGTKQLILDGFKYAVSMWNNGYNGCVDPVPFLTPRETPVKRPPQSDLSSSDKLAVIAAELQAKGQEHASQILFAVVNMLKAFGE